MELGWNITHGRYVIAMSPPPKSQPVTTTEVTSHRNREILPLESRAITSGFGADDSGSGDGYGFEKVIVKVRRWRCGHGAEGDGED